MKHLLLAFALYGLAIVISFLVALLIKGIVVSLTRPIPPAVQRPAVNRNPPQDDLVAITAAVYAMLGPQRIVHIEAGERGRLWTAAARASHHSSHDIDHRRH